MKKILLVVLSLIALISSNVVASIITHSNKDLTNSSYILSLNNQQYSEQYQEVMTLAQNGELAKAKQVLAYLLTQNPLDITALDISGNILLAENKIPQALNAFQRALTDNQSPNIMAKLGVCFLLNENFQQAKLWLTQALSLSPHNKLALRYLAWMEGNAANKTAQLHYLSQLVNLSKDMPSLYEFHQEYIALLIEQNYFQQALNFFNDNNAKIAISNLEVANSLKLLDIELLVRLKNFEAATVKFNQFPVPPPESKIALNYAILSVFYHAHLKNYQQAESIVSSKLKANHEAKSIALYALAKAYFDHKEYSRAHKSLRLLLDNEPLLPKQMAYIDDIVANYSVQSRYSDAIKFLKTHIKKSPQVVQYHHQLAELYILSGRTKAANTQLDKIIAEFPQYIPSYIVKGRQLIKSDTTSEIITFLNDALIKHPKAPELWLDLSKYYQSKNQPKEALKTLEKALEKNGENPLLTFELATLYDVNNLLTKSEPLYIKVLQNYPEYLPALDNLASNFFTLNKDLDKAIVLAKRAYLLSPNDAFIKNLRAQAHIAENQSDSAIKMLTPILKDFGDSGLGHLSLAKAYHKADDKKLANEHLTIALKKSLPKLVKDSALSLQKSWSK